MIVFLFFLNKSALKNAFDFEMTNIVSGELNHSGCLNCQVFLVQTKFIRSTREHDISSQKTKIHEDVDRVFAADQYDLLPFERTILEVPSMRFLFVRPGFCYRLLSDSTSRWTPLPFANSSY